MAELDNQTLQISGQVDSWDGKAEEDAKKARQDSLAVFEKQESERSREWFLERGRNNSDKEKLAHQLKELCSAYAAEEASGAAEREAWERLKRAKKLVEDARKEYDLHEDRSESSRQDAEVEAASA